MFKNLGNLGSMLKQASQISGRMKEMSDKLKTLRATGSAGGGMVEVEVNGLVEVLNCRIDEQLLQSPDKELLEDLITTAVNQAIVKAKELHAESIKDVTGGMEIPGLQDALEKFTGGASS